MIVIVLLVAGETSVGTWSIRVSYDLKHVPPLQSLGFEAKLSHVELVLYGTTEQHVNDKKSNPELAKLRRGQEKVAIEEQHQFDKKMSDRIGQVIGLYRYHFHLFWVFRVVQFEQDAQLFKWLS